MNASGKLKLELKS